jgi:ADP-ribose pyrophosphatase YjhB (NUDIX family)
VDDTLLMFAVIISQSNGKWVMCKHKERDTYEVPGGHREEGEDILETAKRELQEETGAVKFDLKPLCVYSVTGKTRVNETGEEKLLELGADSFWYWDVGAFVFAGDETTVSVSGKQYVTTDRVIADNDIITIDLSPQACNIWGDYARTIVVENGNVVDDIEKIENPEWKSGLQMEEKLHAELVAFVTSETDFEELYYHMNEFIVENGFVNLDFMGNLGHSIVKDKGDRIYIEKGNTTKLGKVKYFTFEPHIAFPDSKYGYKKGNIYYFDGDMLVEI